MRFLLISPNREHLPDPVVPLGMLHLATALRGRHACQLLDLCFEPDPAAAVASAIDAFRPEAVGLSLRNLNTNLYDEESREALLASFAAVADQVRSLTDGPLVVGGSGFSLQPRRLMTMLRADIGVVGEGENAIVAILDSLEADGRPPEPVLVHAGGGGLGGAPVQIRDLPVTDRTQTDPRHIELHGTANVQTKRGCAFKCDYCTYPDLEGRIFRTRDPQRVADEFEAAIASGAQHVFVVDSVFNTPISHAEAVCDVLVERGIQVPWTCYATPAGFTPRLLGKMVRAGCVGAEIGTDAGTDAQLARLQKPFRTRQIREARRLFREAGLHDAHTLVLGAPGETLDETKQTLDLMAELDPDIAIFMVWKEDRESRTLERSRNYEAIRDLLRERAPAHTGWVVPNLEVRFTSPVMRLVRRAGARGPAWLFLAAARRNQLRRVSGLGRGRPAAVQVS